MQRAVIILAAVLSLYWYYLGPDLGKDIARGVAGALPGANSFPGPSPQIGRDEFQRDFPGVGVFAGGERVEVGVGEARAFGMENGEARSQCSINWLAAVNGRPDGARIEAAVRPGREGIFSWHQMQIVGADGRKVAELIRPGARTSTD